LLEFVSCILKCRQCFLHKEFISVAMRKRDLSVRKSGVTCDPHWLVHVNGLTLLYIREKTAIHFTVLKMLGATIQNLVTPVARDPGILHPLI